MNLMRHSLVPTFSCFHQILQEYICYKESTAFERVKLNKEEKGDCWKSSQSNAQQKHFQFPN